MEDPKVQSAYLGIKQAAEKQFAGWSSIQSLA
jgi:hypothetical protein